MAYQARISARINAPRVRHQHAHEINIKKKKKRNSRIIGGVK